MSKVNIDVMTLFPEIFSLTMNLGVIGKAIRGGIVDLRCHQIRDFAYNKHKKVDDYPFGGGKGMVMLAEPIFQAFEYIKKIRGTTPFLVMMSPKGEVLHQNVIKRFKNIKNMSILCGRYEGIDQRVIDEIVDCEISIGDYVLTGGELPGMIFLDSFLRIIPEVLSSDECFENESHYSGLLEYPQYTRPRIWHNKKVPEVLISGNHRKISEWKQKQSYELTKKLRPDLTFD